MHWTHAFLHMAPSPVKALYQIFAITLSPCRKKVLFPPRQCFSKNLFPRQQKEIISDCNLTQTHNYLVDKRTLNHLAQSDQFRKVVERSFMN